MTHEQNPMTQYHQVVEDLLGDLHVVADRILGNETKIERVFSQEEVISVEPAMSYKMHVDLSRGEGGAIIADWTITTNNGAEVSIEPRKFVFPSRALGSARELLRGITPETLSEEGEPEEVQQLHALLGNLLTIPEFRGNEEGTADFVQVMSNREKQRYQSISNLFQGI